jgi:hypothetical protein
VIGIDLDGRPLRLRPVKSPRARRMSLRLDPTDGSVVLVLPTKVGLEQGLAFVHAHKDWLSRRLAAIPAAQPFVDGALVPLGGTPHRIRHVPARRGGVWIEEGEIHVTGGAEFLSRRLTDWLKGRAREACGARAEPMAQAIGHSYRSLRVTDTRSRWGSCTSRGDLSLSWRLVLAPPSVLDYVVAHEVAHLAEMNHSPAFWRVVGHLVANPAAARSWLKSHGAQLHCHGRVG